jgi:hypothetical protein
VKRTLVSFDIDGTLECGQPPGMVPLTLVTTAQQLGYLVGSCSDRRIAYQQALWSALGIAVDFTVLKHRLGELKAHFAASAYYHVGDADADARYARGAGFRFLKADAAGHAAWAPELFGTSG